MAKDKSGEAEALAPPPEEVEEVVEEVPESTEVTEVEEAPDQVQEGTPLGEPEATIGEGEKPNLPEPGQVTS